MIKKVLIFFIDLVFNKFNFIVNIIILNFIEIIIVGKVKELYNHIFL
jgi:hypothetical protein